MLKYQVLSTKGLAIYNIMPNNQILEGGEGNEKIIPSSIKKLGVLIEMF